MILVFNKRFFGKEHNHFLLHFDKKCPTSLSVHLVKPLLEECFDLKHPVEGASSRDFSPSCPSVLPPWRPGSRPAHSLNSIPKAKKKEKKRKNIHNHSNNDKTSRSHTACFVSAGLRDGVPYPSRKLFRYVMRIMWCHLQHLRQRHNVSAFTLHVRGGLRQMWMTMRLVSGRADLLGTDGAPFGGPPRYLPPFFFYYRCIFIAGGGGEM